MYTDQWRDLLTMERRYCMLCHMPLGTIEGAKAEWVKIGGLEILPPQTSIDKYGRARYMTKLRHRMIKHLREEHSIEDRPAHLPKIKHRWPQ